MARKPPPPATKKPNSGKTVANRKGSAGEDRALWEHVTQSVTPLNNKRAAATKKRSDDSPPVPPTPAATPRKTRAAKPAATATPQRSTRDIGTASNKAATATPTKPSRTHAGFDRATETKLRKGQLDIEGRIDLHGMTQDEAYRALTRFVTRAYAQYKRTLLVITGKGRVSQGGGILRRLLPLWVGEHDLKHCVLAVTPAASKDGGDGAFYLRLRKHKD